MNEAQKEAAGVGERRAVAGRGARPLRVATRRCDRTTRAATPASTQPCNICLQTIWRSRLKLAQNLPDVHGAQGGGRRDVRRRGGGGNVGRPPQVR